MNALILFGILVALFAIACAVETISNYVEYGEAPEWFGKAFKVCENVMIIAFTVFLGYGLVMLTLNSPEFVFGIIGLIACVVLVVYMLDICKPK